VGAPNTVNASSRLEIKTVRRIRIAELRGKGGRSVAWRKTNASRCPLRVAEWFVEPCGMWQWLGIE